MIHEITYPCKIDNSMQPAMFYQAVSPEPRPLLVALHTWSFDHSHGFKNYADITVGGRRFTMVHGGIAGYDPNRPLDDYGIGELAFGREDYGQPKFNEEGRFLVTGHTPTALIDPNFRGKIFHGHDHIGLDCGAVFGLGLGCLCLDTLEEFYVI